VSMLSRSRSGGSFTTLRTLRDGLEVVQGGCVVQRARRILCAVRTKATFPLQKRGMFESSKDYSTPCVPANRPKTARKTAQKGTRRVPCFGGN
jgi:hypothetical protein